ncbi:hypothetical protein CYMTET_32620 [Cymbomonas tetramitiformis]|uniref:Uncharacterized protein n=1 Tax=Cymbomonas tetramitiformis TaxID=36881 RepID=A0AAE0FF28_9CHLO|nr:hypothetical protein CYMTET_32620 [Cymbomonas tetramitiformis]
MGYMGEDMAEEAEADDDGGEDAKTRRRHSAVAWDGRRRTEYRVASHAICAYDSKLYIWGGFGPDPRTGASTEVKAEEYEDEEKEEEEDEEVEGGEVAERGPATSFTWYACPRDRTTQAGSLQS